jgi:N utilization substance protein B
MYSKSLARELSLIALGLIKDKGDFQLNKFQIEEIFESALDTLVNHCRDELDYCESELENASQKILDSELQEGVDSTYANVRDEIKKSLKKIETVMNTLSLILDFPKLIVSSGQLDIREDVNKRIINIITNLKMIDYEIDHVMDGWRLKRLPRIDRDILRLAYVDISVEDAYRPIISAGIVNPDEKNNTTNPTFSKLFSQLRASTNTSS